MTPRCFFIFGLPDSQSQLLLSTVGTDHGKTEPSSEASRTFSLRLFSDGVGSGEIETSENRPVQLKIIPGSLVTNSGEVIIHPWFLNVEFP